MWCFEEGLDVCLHTPIGICFIFGDFQCFAHFWQKYQQESVFVAKCTTQCLQHLHLLGQFKFFSTGLISVKCDVLWNKMGFLVRKWRNCTFETNYSLQTIMRCLKCCSYLQHFFWCMDGTHFKEVYPSPSKSLSTWIMHYLKDSCFSNKGRFLTETFAKLHRRFCLSMELITNTVLAMLGMVELVLRLGNVWGFETLTFGSGDIQKVLRIYIYIYMRYFFIEQYFNEDNTCPNSYFVALAS